MVYYILMSFTNCDALTTNKLDKLQVPKLATMGFRKIFWKVFSDYFELDVQDSVTWVGEPMNIEHVSMLTSDEMALDGMEGSDTFLIVKVESKCDLERRIANYKKVKHASDSDLIELLKQEISDVSVNELLDKCKCKVGTYPSLSIVLEKEVHSPNHVLPCFIVFYYYAWLVFQRLERSQGDLIICDDAKRSFAKQSKEIINHRIRLININRYFLTMNRTQIPSLQATIDSLIEKYKLRDRYDRHFEIHKGFEEHINNLSKFTEAERGKTLRLVFNLVTYVAIPFGVFGALSQIDLGSVVYVNPTEIIYSEPLWKALLFSFLLPGSLFGLAYIVDKLWYKFKAAGKK